MQGIKPALIDESRGIGEQSRNRPVRRVPRISQAQPSRRPTPCGGLLSDVTAPARCSSKIARKLERNRAEAMTDVTQVT